MLALPNQNKVLPRCAKKNKFRSGRLYKKIVPNTRARVLSQTLEQECCPKHSSLGTARMKKKANDEQIIWK